MIYVLWEFTVRAQQSAEFERAYKSDGRWAQLFRRDPAYRETILVKDSKQTERYLTIDVWEDRDSYQRFKERFAAEYHQTDQECEKLTSGERIIGIFEKV